MLKNKFAIRKALRMPIEKLLEIKLKLIEQGPQGVGRLIDLGICDFALNWRQAKGLE